MAKQTCAICGAEINLIQQVKLADGAYICRKNCKPKAFKDFDYMHATLPSVKAHHAQVERGTKLWQTYFVPQRKKLVRFGSPVYVAEDVGLLAYVETRYKIFIFGKSELACVYRIADLVGYNYEVIDTQTSDGKTEKQEICRLTFRNVEGMNEVVFKIPGKKSFEKLEKYFNTLFGIQKTLGNVGNTWKSQINAAKAIGSAIKAAASGDEAALEDTAGDAAEALDAAIYGDRTAWIEKADAALAKVE